MSVDQYRTTFRACSINASRHKPESIKTTLQRLADATAEQELTDNYGSGDLIESFEQEVAAMLGKEAAVFMPSGTMAQPMALRIWADLARTDYVALHATNHVALHEHNSYQVLWQLKGSELGESHRVPLLADLKAAARDPLAAILLELPMREIGGQLPEWNDLVMQSEWAHEQGIKLHMDGARLWQCPAAYNKSLAEIAALFDSVYVSFYKDLGGIAGAILAGSEDFIARARVWQRRVGGTLYALYPYVIAAREGLVNHRDTLPERHEQARWLAGQLNQVPGIRTWPEVPHTNMFRLQIRCKPEAFLVQGEHWMQQHQVALIPPPYRTDADAIHCEITIGDAFGLLTKEDWSKWIHQYENDMADVLNT
jgi:threonine aldolase